MGFKRVLFSTDAFLDLMGSTDERPWHDDVVALVTRCLETDVSLLLSAGSLRDVYRLMRGVGCSHAEATERLHAVLPLFALVDLASVQVLAGLESADGAFEQALLRAQAVEAKADAVVSAYGQGVAAAPSLFMTARECLDLLDQEVDQ